jgi:hypothetical protein
MLEIFISLNVSTIFLFNSSGTLWSNDRFPASIWKTGIFLLFAEITDKQLFVSPYSNNASGLIFPIRLSDLDITFAIVWAAFFAAESKK